MRDVTRGIKAAFHDIDIDTYTDIFMRNLAMMSVSVSMLVSWNATSTDHTTTQRDVIGCNNEILC